MTAAHNSKVKSGGLCDHTNIRSPYEHSVCFFLNVSKINLLRNIFKTYPYKSQRQENLFLVVSVHFFKKEKKIFINIILFSVFLIKNYLSETLLDKSL